MKTFNYVKSGLGHSIGNMISGVIHIVEGLILILSLGKISSNLSMKWCFLRTNTWFYGSKRI